MFANASNIKTLIRQEGFLGRLLFPRGYWMLGHRRMPAANIANFQGGHDVTHAAKVSPM